MFILDAFALVGFLRINIDFIAKNTRDKLLFPIPENVLGSWSLVLLQGKEHKSLLKAF